MIISFSKNNRKDEKKMEDKKAKSNPMIKLATVIVDKRKAVFLFFIIAAVFCVCAMGWVSINNDITTYLPDTTETRQGLTIMDDQFTTYGTASVMIDNITYADAEKLAEQIEEIEGVTTAEFDNTEGHYKDGSALFSITFGGEAEDEISVAAMNQMKEMLAPYDLYISSEVGSSMSETIAAEMQVVVVIVLAIIIAVLLFTSHTYLEIPVLLITFGAAAILNMGTNFLFGEISFVSNSIAVVLQLALAIDYAIILCNRYFEERAKAEPREAVIIALSKAIPEISSSCLTTVSGLVAMMFMQFKLGFDLGIVLIKAIMFSIVSVFLLMPGLLMLFSKGIDKTHHRNFVPNITAVGKADVATRYIIPPIFLVFLVGGFILSNQCNYVYGYSTLSTYTKNASQIAEEKINDKFGSDNLVVVMVPAGDYKTEGQLLKAFEEQEVVNSALGLANVKATDDYMLTDALTPRQFAEMIDMDIEAVKVIYSAYAYDRDDFGQIVSGLDAYAVPLIDMFGFVYEQKEEGYVSLDDDLNDTIDDLNRQITDAKAQLQGEDYSRMLIFTSLDEEGEETFEWLNRFHDIMHEYYPGQGYIVGDSTSDYDLSSSFVDDNLMISVLSGLFVLVILVFTFKSAGLPVLLLLIIEGSIWLNFSFPVITDTNIFFLAYLIVSSIQMGANIDYAIVISNRYTELKKEMSPKKAIVETLNQAFPTIITSGAILAVAGLLIGFLSSDPTISSIGICLGRGTFISIFLVMCVLPQILLVGDIIIEKTSFTIKRPETVKNRTGIIKVNGRVRGYVSGIVDAEINGIIRGDVNAMLETDDGQLKEKVDKQITERLKEVSDRLEE
ncbi:MAG: RND family transporter [Ruminiclostridium sp.]